jgi:hypothetical protein
MPHSRDGQRKKCHCGAHAAGGVEPAQLIGDERYSHRLLRGDGA